MPDLKVDLGELQSTAATLRSLVEQFNHSSHIADGYADAVGASELADALHDFGSDWDDHKGKIVDTLTTTAKMAENSRQVFEQTDHKLAGGLQQASAAAPAAGRAQAR